jgi:hypothetical protein
MSPEGMHSTDMDAIFYEFNHRKFCSTPGRSRKISSSGEVDSRHFKELRKHNPFFVICVTFTV